MEWELVIGLEVHAQLRTQSKLFSGAGTTFGASPNTQASYIDAGLPGTLPVLNHDALVMAVRFGLATDCIIHHESVFERKNYFYPDLPKGYQISQFQHPILTQGKLIICRLDGTTKTINIMRAHLEEDAGKSIHGICHGQTGIDLNRAGTPLLEIVTTPCMHTSEEVIAYLKKLHQLVRFLGICDGSMQEGSFRCDVNMSVREKGSEHLGVRTEIKNMNSFRFIDKAIAYEFSRHVEHLKQGTPLIQETRLYHPESDKTYVMREKEAVNDYRYFPDPDLLPVRISNAFIDEVRSFMPELPDAIIERLSSSTDLSADDIQFLVSDPDVYQYYRKVKVLCHAEDKPIVNWIKGSLTAVLNDLNLSFNQAPVAPELLARLINKIHDRSLSNHHARAVFRFLCSGEHDLDAIILREGFDAVFSDNALEAMIQSIIEKHPSQVVDYQSGKDKLFGFFLGQLMKETKGQANPEIAQILLKEALVKKA